MTPDFDSRPAAGDDFRGEARSWLAANFPVSLAGQGGIMISEQPLPFDGDFAVWKARMVERGWAVPTWPREYGGGGLSEIEASILKEEMVAIGAFSPVGGLGVMMFGPTLLEFGTAEQKRRHIPPIARGELVWCQGFSEPGAGSDLASLQTRAIDDGDHYVVTGSKIWTSAANFADWCFCLVRTERGRKHEGISFLMIDMRSPGVDVRPITLISGSSPFCETFFTDVRAPKENLVGPLNGGWTVAKRLLQHERSSISGSSAGRYNIERAPLVALARDGCGTDGEGRLADADLRARLVRHDMEARAYELTLRRLREEAAQQQGPNATTSILKNVMSQLVQSHHELAVEARGSGGLGWEGPGFPVEALTGLRSFLRSKSLSIAGGSFEVQNNIVAKRILGLPDATPAAEKG